MDGYERMNKFNLSEWALEHRQFCYFLMVLCFCAGVFSYINLGRDEDPSYTIRTMVVMTTLPGATAEEVEMQVTDKIEKRLADTPDLDYLESYSKPGVSVVYVNLNDFVAKEEIPITWKKVRNLVEDIVPTLPEGTLPPAYNDDFGDTFGSIYALYGKDYSFNELEEVAEWVRKTFLRIPDVSKVEFSGVKKEKIFIETDSAKLASFGINPSLISQAINDQNKIVPAGMLTTPSHNLYSRLSGSLNTVEMIKNAPIYANNSLINVSDIAHVRRGYSEDPPDNKMYFNGIPAIAIEVSMKTGGNILKLGENLSSSLQQIRAELPAGMEISQVSDQPKVVKDSIDVFVETLVLAILIVLAVNFLSLGLRAGLVVALSIPLVLCIVMTVMKLSDINLQKISLGALIIALGLLVDDAIISVEMMETKLEEGMEKIHAASFAYTATAFPMLTGTIVTIAGFMPVGFSSGSSAEFVGSIFWVVGIALITSWIVSVSVIPLLGVHLLKTKPINHEKEKDMESILTVHFRKFLSSCLRHRWIVIGITAAIFVLSLYCFRFVSQEFFPASTRPELMVNIDLPIGSSLEATNAETMRFIEMIKDEPGIENIATYVGVGSPRFVLVLDMKLDNSYFSQTVILTKGEKERDALRTKLEAEVFPKFPNAKIRASILTNGPPSPYPVMLRVSGVKRGDTVKLAEKVRDVLRTDPRITDITFNWYEMAPAMRLQIDQEKVRSLGINNALLASSLQSAISGSNIGEFREGNKTISVELRAPYYERNEVKKLLDLYVYIADGTYVRLDEIAKIVPVMEYPVIWRRNSLPTVKVQADTIKGVTGNDAAQALWEKMAPIREGLPLDYSIEQDGDAEQSKKSSDGLMRVVPAMIIIILIVLMMQLQDNLKMFIVILTAPLGIIGVVAAMIIFSRAMGFVAILGVLALSGMIIRNSVILVDQITKHIRQGEHPWDAIIDSTLLRFRPIMLTALAAILGMIPLFNDQFWGPMAVAIAGGLLVATVLTLVFLPALYAAVFNVRKDY